MIFFQVVTMASMKDYLQSQMMICESYLAYVYTFFGYVFIPIDIYYLFLLFLYWLFEYLRQE